jgi:hypothetical protein
VDDLRDVVIGKLPWDCWFTVTGLSTILFYDNKARKKACKLLREKLNRPRMKDLRLVVDRH